MTNIPFSDALPARLTRERYIRIYRKIFATLRHDQFVKVKEYLHNNNVSKCPEDRWNEMWAETWGTFESVREDIYNLMMAKKGQDYSQVPQKQCKRHMQLAYITYATIASQTNNGAEPTRSRWADQVTEAANSHAKAIESMKNGEFYE